jgi:methylenetetrahydrofolate reductase (NADPH)
LKEAYSNLVKEINAGGFVFTGELEPEKTTNLTELVEAARSMVGYVVACNVTDSPQSMAYMSSLVASYIIQKESGMECVYQLRCSDRNRIALTSDLLGAASLGIKNILALTGDHTSLGDNSEAKAVFDLDSARLTYMIRKMVDEGEDLNGNKIHDPPKFHVGIAGNPNSDPLEAEILKIKRKEDIGAEFIQTQVVFDMEKVNAFLVEMGDHHIDIPVLMGIFPLKTYEVADYFNKYIPGVSVPQELMDEMKKISEISDKARRREKYAEVNLDYFTDFIKDIQKTSAAGVHVMAVGYEEILRELIKRAKGE